VIYAVARDVSERLRLEEERFRLLEIVESARDAIIGKDLDGLIQSWNSGAEKLFGYAAEEMIGHSISRLLPADRLDEETEILRITREGGRVEHFETVRLHKSGARIEISVSISPIRDAKGKIIGASKFARKVNK
jgi:PAS domain S-box-containing protein